MVSAASASRLAIFSENWGYSGVSQIERKLSNRNWYFSNFFCGGFLPKRQGFVASILYTHVVGSVIETIANSLPHVKFTFRLKISGVYIGQIRGTIRKPSNKKPSKLENPFTRRLSPQLYRYAFGTASRRRFAFFLSRTIQTIDYSSIPTRWLRISLRFS